VFTTKYAKNQPKPARVKKYADGGKVRSERTEYEQARRKRASVPPVTILEDAIGRVNEAKGSDNALRTAIREREADRMKATGYKPKRGSSGRYDDVE
jgi:hypothetical protein